MEYRRKTKIVCTIGPASESEEKLEQLMKAGMNVVRINFSHGTHEEHLVKLDHIRKVRDKLALPVATLLDTKGPEIRLRDFENGFVVLEEGQKFTLTTKDVQGNQDRVSITFQDLPKDVSVGASILIDDGLVEMTVEEVTATDVVCRVTNGGKISNKKGVNVPNVELSMPYVSKRDFEDLIFGIEQEFDYVAASFTRTADDIYEIRKILRENGGADIQIIAKIENNQGVEHIDEIIEAADGIMVARGDMGVEIPLEEVPVIQKMIIKKVYEAGKIVITATQMLDSMMTHPRPTRAEATDVANAVYDGTSAIMLSGETAAGQYPVESVEIMDQIAQRAEQDIDYMRRLRNRNALVQNPSVTDAVSHSACLMAGDLDATAIVTVTRSGGTVHAVSKYRPVSPIIAGCTDERVCRQLNLCWGATPFMLAEETNADVLFERAIAKCQEKGLVSEGDKVIVIAGVPLGESGTTNMMRVQTVKPKKILRY